MSRTFPQLVRSTIIAALVEHGHFDRGHALVLRAVAVDLVAPPRPSSTDAARNAAGSARKSASRTRASEGSSLDAFVVGVALEAAPPLDELAPRALDGCVFRTAFCVLGRPAHACAMHENSAVTASDRLTNGPPARA